MTETRMTWPQAKEGLKPPAAGRGRKDPPLKPEREHGPEDTLIPDFWPPVLGEDKGLLP